MSDLANLAAGIMASGGANSPIFNLKNKKKKSSVMDYLGMADSLIGGLSKGMQQGQQGQQQSQTANDAGGYLRSGGAGGGGPQPQGQPRQPPSSIAAMLGKMPQTNGVQPGQSPMMPPHMQAGAPPMSPGMGGGMPGQMGGMPGQMGGMPQTNGVQPGQSPMMPPSMMQRPPMGGGMPQQPMGMGGGTPQQGMPPRPQAMGGGQGASPFSLGGSLGLAPQQGMPKGPQSAMVGMNDAGGGLNSPSALMAYAQQAAQKAGMSPAWTNKLLAAGKGESGWRNIPGDYGAHGGAGAGPGPHSFGALQFLDKGMLAQAGLNRNDPNLSKKEIDYVVAHPNLLNPNVFHALRNGQGAGGSSGRGGPAGGSTTPPSPMHQSMEQFPDGWRGAAKYLANQPGMTNKRLFNAMTALKPWIEMDDKHAKTAAQLDAQQAKLGQANEKLAHEQEKIDQASQREGDTQENRVAKLQLEAAKVQIERMNAETRQHQEQLSQLRLDYTKEHNTNVLSEHLREFNERINMARQRAAGKDRDDAVKAVEKEYADKMHGISTAVQTQGGALGLPPEKQKELTAQVEAAEAQKKQMLEQLKQKDTPSSPGVQSQRPSIRRGYGGSTGGGGTPVLKKDDKVLEDARRAIREQGVDKDAVVKYLQEQGYDPSGL